MESLSTEAIVSYRHEVGALLSRAGCNMGACHGNLSGKGGFKLSLRGEDLGFDLLAMTRELQGRRLDLVEPGNSLMVQEAAGSIAARGGDTVFARVVRGPDAVRRGSGRERQTTGSRQRRSTVRIFPEVRIIEVPGLRQQLRVTARFEDGQVRDVTHLAAFDVDDPSKRRGDGGRAGGDEGAWARWRWPCGTWTDGR